MDVQSASSTLPLPPARFQTYSAYIHSFTPRRARFPHFQNWRRVLTIAAVIAFVVVLVSILGIFLTMRKKNTLHDCKVIFSVSKAEKSHFRTISQAVDAAPNNSPYNICIFVKKGEYNEVVIIGPEKTNLILLGGGRDQTSITSNASSSHDLRASTLRVEGTGFMAQDLSIINTAHIGVAVDNSAKYSIFFRCKLVGKYRTLHVKMHKQFYRDCLLHGGSYLISEDATAFFQRCQFFHENMYHEKEIIFSTHLDEISNYKTGLIFHLCEFRIVEGLPAQNVFLGKAMGSGCSIVVMQCYLDKYLTGFFIENPAWNDTFFAIYGNRGPGATIEVPPFVHTLEHAEASHFSLRRFFDESEWKPSNRVEYELDVA